MTDTTDKVDEVRRVIDALEGDQMKITTALIREAAQLLRQLSASSALTDEEICAAWNAAGETRPEGLDMYLHYMRAIAKAQRDKLSQYVGAQSSDA